MEPLTLATSFAVVVGLLGQFKTERTTSADDEYQAFTDWLASRRHNTVVAILNENHLLASSVKHLLADNHEEVISKLDGLLLSIVAVAARLDEFKDFSDSVCSHGADVALYERFMSIFGSELPAAYLLEKHAFDTEYRQSDTIGLRTFARTWGSAEFRFIDTELEFAKERFRAKCVEFSAAEAEGTGLIGEGWLSLIPESLRDARDHPQWLINRVAKVTQLAEEAYAELQAFVFFARSKLHM